MIPPEALAPYATRPSETRGRLFPEPEPRDPARSAFARDRDRIIHSAAFRRLKYKTQVFVYHEGDNFRTRLTHSLEVSQIARAVARNLRLDEDLAEALALAHDLGHSPFGHAGEFALKECMARFGGFDHNAQSLKVVTDLERRYAEFDGLNLTWETLEGLVKHNGPLTGPQHGFIDSYNARHDLELATHAGLEAQVAALADDIAYNNHDIDDGLRAGLFSIEEAMEVPLAGPVFREVLERYPGIDRSRLVHETVRRLIGMMIRDLCAETERRIAQAKPGSAVDVRALDRPMAAFSAEMAGHDRAFKDFLFPRMYRHYKVNRMMSKGKRVIRELFQVFLDEPNTLPDEWRALAGEPGDPRTARVVADYIAGMTDRFALDEHRRLFEPTAKP